MNKIYIYTTEIKAMLYSFGDSKSPSTATSQMIEQILQTQTRRFLSVANDVRILRRGKTINLEDICFVIRKEPFKLQRLLNFVDFREIKGKIESKIESVESNDILEDDAEIAEKLMKTKKKKFGWMILPEGVDQFQLNRLEQIDKLTASMSKEEYLHFTECRQSSFVYRKSKKFKEFLGFDNLNENVLDLLGYICYEIVYNITMEILRKRTSSRDLNRSHCISVEEVENIVFEICQNNKLFF